MQSFRELGVINKLLAVTPTLFNFRYVFTVICKKFTIKFVMSAHMEQLGSHKMECCEILY